jgi:hypothetical protein
VLFILVSIIAVGTNPFEQAFLTQPSSLKVQQMSLQSDQDFDEARAKAEVLDRNRVRAAAKLPALSVEDQLQRMKAAYDQKRFEEFMRSPLKEVVEQKLLARMRRRGGDPEWLPTGFLSGGGYLFYVRVRKIMIRVYRMARRRNPRTNPASIIGS